MLNHSNIRATLKEEQGNIVNICSNLNQGGSKMKQSAPIKSQDDFELTNCPDPKCFICVKNLQGYPSELNLHPYHKKQLANSAAVLLTWIESAA